MSGVVETMGFSRDDVDKWQKDLLFALKQDIITDALDHLISKYKANPTELATVIWMYTNIWRDIRKKMEEISQHAGGTLSGMDMGNIKILTNNPEILRDPRTMSFLKHIVESMEEDKK